MSSTPRNRFVPLGAAAVLVFGSARAPAQTLDFHLDGDQGSSRFGQCVSSGVDFDGDGGDDLLVGVPAEDVNGNSNVGVVRVYSGKTHGLLLEIPGPLGSNADFGFAASLVGDVDGDGQCDVVVGAPAYSSHAGWVGAFSGANGNLLWSIYGGTGDDLGASVAAAGDCDHDGHMDVIVGAPGSDDVYLFGWGTGALHVWNGTQSGAQFGASVSGDVDVDGDGTMDVIVGSPYYDSAHPFMTNRGRVDVFSGSNYVSIFAAFGDASGDHLGLAVCGLGDLDFDGRDEVLAGAPQASGGAGLVREYLGNGTPWHDFVDGATTGFGSVVARIPDMDRDAFPDFLVASNPSPTSVVELFSGLYGVRAFKFQPDADSAAFGWSLAGGDVDGDGACDVVVGDAYRMVNSMSCGGVQVFHTVSATWTNYGAGWPGTLGTPSITGVLPPALGTPICAISLTNSNPLATTALVFIGVSSANLQTSKGGTLLVVPSVTIPLALPATGTMLIGALSSDPALLGATFYMQAIEADPGASKGLSFTDGLEGVIGVF